MYKEDRLPQNAKEGILFLLIVSVISVNTIAPIIVGLERGFNIAVYTETLKIIPIMWVIVILLVRAVCGSLSWKNNACYNRPNRWVQCTRAIGYIITCNGIVYFFINHWSLGRNQAN